MTDVLPTAAFPNMYSIARDASWARGGFRGEVEATRHEARGARMWRGAVGVAR